MEFFDYEREHLQYLRKHLGECCVLLKRDGSFPLSGPCDIAAYGSGVRHTVKGGTGSGEVNSTYFVTVEQGLSDAGFRITSGEWLDAYDGVRERAERDFLKKIRADARAHRTLAILEGMGRVMPEPEYELPLDAPAEAAIYVVSRISGEGADRKVERGDILLSDSERRDILALAEKYERFMLVLNVGGVVDLSGLESVGNILLLSQLGAECGAVLADILLGVQSPSGKLATTWAAAEDYYPMDFGDKNDTRYTEGVFVGYRYFDTVGKVPIYPFGHGLTYTDFDIRVSQVSLCDTQVTVKAVVTNIGDRVGKEVVQVYLSSPKGEIPKPRRALATFGKTGPLSPSESEELTMSFDIRDMAAYDERTSEYVLENGSYTVRVGAGADTPAVAKILVDGRCPVLRVSGVLGKTDFDDFVPESIEDTEEPSKIPQLSLGDVECREVCYEAEEPIEPFAEKLSDKELAYAAVGSFNSKGGVLSVIGNASTAVAGAAGESTDKLKKYGLPQIVVADGPAGVRVSPEFYRDERGAHSIGGSGMPETMAALLPRPVRWLMSVFSGKKTAPQGKTVEHQRATALPIATAVAQSWNLEFARGCGRIVGDEMKRFGVHLWLAPALNIHRSIRCGRNFEYYSEDPTVSGKMAVAVSLGVQSVGGVGVTLKHYAANNQETNRYGSNSIVSERAMREIYLKGFELCVREAAPDAVMTSYNLLCGVHTAERRDLCRDILRREFGFEGIVMTDWVVAGGIMCDRRDKHPRVVPYKVAAAGGELFMPGCGSDFRNVLRALRKGRLDRRQLQINVSGLYRLARKLGIN